MERVACFIDASYLDNIAKKFLDVFEKPFKFDYQKIIDEMRNGRPLLRTYYYTCPVFIGEEPTEEEKELQTNQNRFFDRLQALPQFECRFGRLTRHIDGSFEQKRVDVMFATDIVVSSTKHLVSNIVLITGDSDMIPAIQIAKNEGIVVELFYMRGTAHTDLLKTVDISNPIDQTWINRVKRD